MARRVWWIDDFIPDNAWTLSGSSGDSITWLQALKLYDGVFKWRWTTISCGPPCTGPGHNAGHYGYEAMTAVTQYIIAFYTYDSISIS